MLYPRLIEPMKETSGTGVFLGYQHIDAPADGAFYDTQNVSLDNYPYLSNRPDRAVVRELENPQGIIGKEALYTVEDGSLYRDGVFMGWAPMEGEKQLLSMGTRLLIWPDKRSLDTSLEPDETDLTELLECMALGWVYKVTPTMLGRDEDDIESKTWIGSTAPEDPERYPYWLDEEKEIFYLYNRNSGMWEMQDSTYLKISFTQATDKLWELFDVYDAVTISGSEFDWLNGDYVIYETGKNYIKVPGLSAHAVTGMDSPLNIQRTIPDMDFVVEHNNRVWGCSSKTNQIYASALGKPTNWNRFMGLADDSYSVTVGTDGPFTGAAVHLGYVLFFKEDCIHRVYGTDPTNFTTTTMNCRGVERGSSKSLQTVNEVLYYKSTDGICAFDGNMPSLISQALGRVQYKNAAAGAWRDKLYLNMEDEAGTRNMFTLDTRRGLWCREDTLPVTAFARTASALYAVSGNRLMRLAGQAAPGETKEPEARWMVETGRLGIESMNAKYISRLQIRILLPADSEVKAYVEYDSSGSWELAGKVRSPRTKAMTWPIRLHRCDHMRLRIVGAGAFTLLGLAKLTEYTESTQR